MALTVAPALAVVVPFPQQKRLATPEALACALADSGLGASFCVSQPEGRDVWEPAGELLALWGLP